MKIVVGLGNPGKEYEKTRHNVGWIFLKYLEDKYGFEIKKKSFNSLICETTINGHKIVFAKPQTYMNLSGAAVQKLKQWYKVENEDILVIFDDIDIPFGTCRFKVNGSGGTHNGMKDIVQAIASKDFSRIKIGIGGIKHEKQDLRDFVLQRFNSEELIELEKVFKEAEEKLELFLDKSSN